MNFEDVCNDSSSITIRNELRPGDIGFLIYLHGILYNKEYNFDYTFEPYVAGPLAEFVLTRTNKERIWIVEQDGQIKGSIAIVNFSESEAQLRWLLLHPDIRGKKIGKLLVKKAIDFSKKSGYSSIFLWTVDFLTTATNLYKSFGFELTEENVHKIWGVDVVEQRYDRKL